MKRSFLKISIKYIFVLAIILTFSGVCFGASSTTWTGTTSSDWNTASNWSNGVPTSSVGATIGGGTYQPTLSTTATAGTYRCASLTVNGNAILTISSGFTLNVVGSLTIGSSTNTAAALTVSGLGSLSIGGDYSNWGNAAFGSGPLTISGNFTDNTNTTTFGTGLVTFNSTSSSAKITVVPKEKLIFTYIAFANGQFNFKSNTGATAGFAITSTGVMTLSANAKLIFSNTFGLTLYSDANGSATIAAIPSGCSIGSTKIYVQRFIKGSHTGGTSGDLSKRGYRLMSSTVNNGTSNISNFHYLTSYLYISGYGKAANGFNVPTTTNPSIYLFREDCPPPPNDNTIFTTGYNWKGVASINSVNLNGDTVIGTQKKLTTTNISDTSVTLPQGNGFLLYFRGNNTPGGNGSTTGNQYTSPFNYPDDVTLVQAGSVNTGTIPVTLWYSAAASLGTALSYSSQYTDASTYQGNIIGGFNLVGNPYPSTINWEKYNNPAASGALTGTVSNTIWEFDELNHQYVSYIATQNADVTSERLGLYNGSATNMIASGQGFFVQATAKGQTLTFTENAKVTLPLPANLPNMMSTPQAIATATRATAQHSLLRLRMVLDSINSDEVLINFNSNANAKFVPGEDAIDLGGSGALESLSVLSSDSVNLAISQTPFPGAQREIIPLLVNATASQTFQLTVPEQNIPKQYQIWLKDSFTGDSVNLKQVRSYSFSIDKTNPATFGSKRLSVIISQDPAYAYRLLSFTAARVGNSSNVETHWTTANEQNYTNFTVERSSDDGKTFTVVGGMWGTGAGDYSLMDKNVPFGTTLYRLKSEDINNTITYSNTATVLITENGNNNADKIRLYPNPATSIVNLDMVDKANGNSSYSITVSNNTGLIVKQVTSSQSKWQADVSNLMPGTYLVRVINTKTQSFVGESKFVKL